MIKYYDTDAAYKADTGKGAVESQVSLIKAGNVCRYDGRNVVVGLSSARTGSVAYLDGSHSLHFAAPGTFKADGLPEGGEVIGVVVIGVDHPDFRGEVAVMSHQFTGAPLFIRCYFKLSGYTLDGAEHTGVLSTRSSLDNWATNQDYTITYKADNIVTLVSQLNAYFKANEPFIAQDWVAIADINGDVLLHFKYTTWQQSAYNTAKSGFSIVSATAPQWKSTSIMFRMNGGKNGEGTIINMPKALEYFRKDNSSATYNPATDVNTAKLSYPICLPGYLGKSKYQSDHCAYLRGIYGEGEEGWLKFMRSFLPVLPSEEGIFDDSTYGTEKQNTYYLASLKYVGQDGVEKYVSPAAKLAAERGFDHELLKRGEWVIGKISRIFSIVGQLRYPTTPDKFADKVNAALAAIGAPALGNNSTVWSCSRFSEIYSWIAYGNSGFAANYCLCNSPLAVPLVLLDTAADGAA
nr:MAG TPA: hypothetical protein [Caudoviricetes sp.]